MEPLGRVYARPNSRRFAASWLMIAVASAGCNVLGSDTTEFTVRVDSITIPSVVSPDETLSVGFWGNLGPDLCSRLARIESGRGPGVLEIKFRGERVEDRQCSQMPAKLEHEERLTPPFEDPFTIRVLQPVGSPLEKVVHFP
jgi:hypothetical protein